MERGWLDDEELARSIVHGGQKANKGWPRIYGDLRRRGITRELAEESLRNHFDYRKERESARRLLRDELGASPPLPGDGDMERAVRRMARRGFSPSAIAGAVDDLARDEDLLADV